MKRVWVIGFVLIAICGVLILISGCVYICSVKQLWCFEDQSRASYTRANMTRGARMEVEMVAAKENASHAPAGAGNSVILPSETQP
jgi:hypothetical protein